MSVALVSIGDAFEQVSILIVEFLIINLVIGWAAFMALDILQQLAFIGGVV